MEHVKVIFGRGNAVISDVILFVSRSEWSHVAYIDENSGYIIEAAGGIGVIASTYDNFKSRYPRHLIAQIPVKDAKLFREVMISLIGAEYDFKAILGILLHKDWNDNNKWTCSEAIAHASGLFRKNKLHCVTQEVIYMMSVDSRFDFDKFFTVDVRPSQLHLMGFY